MLVKALGAVYLTKEELSKASSVSASNEVWLPDGLKPLENAFVGYSGKSKDNLLAMSESMISAELQGKNAYIYEFKIETINSKNYVSEDQLPNVDSIDLANCEKSILEAICKLAIECGYEDAAKAKATRADVETIDKNLLYSFIGANPAIMRQVKETGLIPNLRYFLLPYAVNGKAYVMLYILDPSCIETGKHGICYVTIKGTQSVVLMFPMYKESQLF